MFSRIISTLGDCEHIRFSTYIEHMVPSLALGVIDPGFARSTMRTLFNEAVHDTVISRNANFKPDDQTGVLNYHNPKLYIERLGHEGGEETVEYLRKGERIFPYQAHDIMVHLEHLDDLEFDYKIIEVYRHPVDNINSWYTQGWGERFGNDPYAFTLTIEYDGKMLPWYCVGYEEEWLSLNPMERCIRTANDLIQKSVAQQKKAKNPDRIITVVYEEMVEKPDAQMARISEFVGSPLTPWTAPALAKENLPIVLKPESRQKKLDAFRAGVSSELFDQLVAISEEYEKDLYGLR